MGGMLTMGGPLSQMPRSRDVHRHAIDGSDGDDVWIRLPLPRRVDRREIEACTELTQQDTRLQQRKVLSQAVPRTRGEWQELSEGERWV